jgi:molecular chaperone DnaJ
MQYHPDRNPGDKVAEERFKEAAEAYAVLCDPEKRSLYDRFGHQGVRGAGGGPGFDPSVFSEFGDFADILGNMFGFGDLFGGARRRGGPQRGADLRYDLEISFEESAKGAETTFLIPGQEPCENCGGSGAAAGSSPSTCPQCRGQGQVRMQQGFFTVARTCPRCQGAGKIITRPCATCRGAGRLTRERKLSVKIPPGIATGQQLRLQSEGESGTGGGPSGHLYVVVHVQDHEFFRRDGNNLFCDGTTLKLRGKGMPDVSGRGRGDLFATVQVQTPRKLTREQRHLLEQLAEALPQEQFEPRSPGDAQNERNLFDRVKDMFG